MVPGVTGAPGVHAVTSVNTPGTGPVMIHHPNMQDLVAQGMTQENIRVISTTDEGLFFRE